MGHVKELVSLQSNQGGSPPCLNFRDGFFQKDADDAQGVITDRASVASFSNTGMESPIMEIRRIVGFVIQVFSREVPTDREPSKSNKKVE